MRNKQIFVYLGLMFHSLIAGKVGERCKPNDNYSDGICTLANDCEEAVRDITRQYYHNFKRCGFSGEIEIICCPSAEQPTTPSTANKFGDNGAKRIADQECEKIVSRSVPPLGPHIINGVEADNAEFPHMVALGYERSGTYYFQCGASLLSTTYIISAAHCMDDISYKSPSIARYGVIEVQESEFNEATDINISKIITHPEYLRMSKYHDIALLQLEKPVPFSALVHAICLYTSDKDPTVPLTITGWGRTSRTKNEKSNILLKATVTVVDRSKCKELYGTWYQMINGISEKQICAGDVKRLVDACTGDSGGPLQGFTAQDSQFRLVGITSFGRGCVSPLPGVYTRVSHYLDWIENIVWPN